MQKVQRHDVIFFLHRVYPKKGPDDISLKNFDRFLKLLKQIFKIVPLEDVLYEKSNEKRAVITFDDGYADNFVYAYPLLKKHKVNAHLFVSAGRITEEPPRKTLEDYWNGKVALSELYKPKGMFDAHVDFLLNGKSSEFLSWEELEKMKDVFSYGAHGLNHLAHPCSEEPVDFFDGTNFRWTILTYGWIKTGTPIFPTRSSLDTKIFTPSQEMLELCTSFPKTGKSWKKKLKEELSKLENKGSFETTEEAEKRIEKELLESKRILEENLSRKIETFAWPFGHFSEFSEKIAKKHFKFLFTIKKGIIREGMNPYRLPRVWIGKDIFTFLGRILFFSSEHGFKVYKRFKGGKVI